MGEKNPMYGKTLSEKRKKEHSKRMSGEKHPFYGKHRSERVKRKLSEFNMGKKLPEKTRRKMSKGQMGHVVLEKTRRKIGSKNKGRIMSEEFRQKKRKDRAKQRLPTYDTLPEKLLQKLCKEAEIEFQTQKDFNLGFQNHPVDVFVEPNICIEADGDYPHANPQPHLLPSRSSTIQLGHKPDEIMWRSSKLIKTAKWVWEHDAKITQVLEQQGNVVLRFWQSELETEPEKCLQKIIKIIKKSTISHKKST
jgi:very-short-patch-repair endonuclease